MSRVSDQQWQLGALAFEADLIDSVQLQRALTTWALASDRSLVQVLLEQDSLRQTDIPLLEALWEKQNCHRTRPENTQGHFQPVSHGNATQSPQFLPPAKEGLTSWVALEIDQPLAQGGIGRVDVAHDCKLNRRVAMKRIQPKFSLDANARLRFAQEAEITGVLEHPAIVPIYHYGVSTEGEPFYCMRLIEGKTLKETMTTLESPVEFRRLLNSFITVCRAVDYAHSKQIIHRDIKPANIIIGPHGEAMLVDWGLAKRLDCPNLALRSEHPESTADIGAETNVQLTLDGTSVGTPSYMSPEQAETDGQVGKASDIFGLGATLYFILSGYPPYTGNSSQEILAQARSCAWKSIQVSDQITRSLIAVCQHAMEKRPQDRYANADELANDLERWLADEPVSVWRDSLTTHGRRWIKKNRTAASTLALSLIGLLAASVGFAFHTSSVNRQLSQAVSNEQQSRELAIAQGDLALSSLRTVTFDIQRQLKYVPAAQQVRMRLLETALDGLGRVSAGLAKRTEVDQSIVVAHRDLGDLFLEVGNIGSHPGIANAKQQFEIAERLARTLAEQAPHNAELQRQVVLCQHRRASLRMIDGTTAEVAEIYEDAHRLLERAFQMAPTNELVLRSIAVSHNLQGDLQIKQGQADKAGDHFMAALRILEDQSARQVADEELERDRIVSLNKVGNYLQRIGRLSEAENYFRRSLAASQQRADRIPDDFNALRDLSTALYRVGQVCQSSGRDEEALQHLQASAELDRRRLALDPANSQAGRDCVQSCNELASALTRLGREREASEQLELSITLGENVLKADPTDKRVIRDLAYAYSDLGDLRKIDDVEKALQCFENCLRLMRHSSSLDPDNPRSKSDIAYGLAKHADGLMRISQSEQAIANLTEAILLQRQRLEINPDDVNSQATYIEILQSSVAAHQQAGQVEEAKRIATEAVQAAQKLASQSPANYSAQIVYIHLLQTLSSIASTTGNMVEAKAHLTQAIELLQQFKQRSQIANKDANLESELRTELNKLD